VQIVLVTGASSGVGAALARECAAPGTRLVLADKNAEGVERLAATLGGTPVPSDLRDVAHLADLIDRTEDRVGPIGLICCNAGIATGFDCAGNIAWPSDDIWQAA
jgi:NADP-dependent 3-hydroxy acid dehydrogenase YdfG